MSPRTPTRTDRTNMHSQKHRRSLDSTKTPGRKFHFNLAVLLGLLILTVLSLQNVPVLAEEHSQEKEKLEQAEKQERRILSELETLEKDSSALEEKLIKISDDINDVSRKMDEGARELNILERRRKDQKKYLAQRLKAIYRLRDGGILPVLLRAESFSDLAQTYKRLSMILTRDEEVLKELAQSQQKIKESQARITTEQARLLELKNSLDEERQKTQEAKRKRTALLMQVHRKKELYLALMRSREEAKQRVLKEVIIKPREKTEDEPPAPPPATPAQNETPAARVWPDFKGAKGKIPRPVRGKVIGKFGRESRSV